MNKGTRAVIYARISLDAGNDQKGVESQQQECREHIAKHGWTLVDTYVDNSISATDPRKQRKEYDRLQADFDADRFDIIVCWAMDRLIRQPIQLEDWLQQITNRTLEIVPLHDSHIDLSSTTGRATARTLVAWAHAEVERKSERQKARNKQRRDLKHAYGRGFPVFGYRHGDIKHGEPSMIIEEEDAAHIRAAVKHVLEGGSVSKIQREWNAAGIRSKRSGAAKLDDGWTITGVRNVITQPKIAGIMTYTWLEKDPSDPAGKKMIKKTEVGGNGDWEPIIDRDTYNLLTAHFAKQRAKYNTSREGLGRYPANLLSGVAVCGVCNRKVFGATRRGVPRYGCKNQHAATVREEADAYVNAAVLGYIAQYPEQFPSQTGETVDKADIQRQLKEIQESRHEFSMLRAESGYDPERWRDLMETLKNRETALNLQLASAHEADTRGQLLGAWLKWGEMDTEQKRRMLQTHTQITIYPKYRKKNVPIEEQVKIVFPQRDKDNLDRLGLMPLDEAFKTIDNAFDVPQD